MMRSNSISRRLQEVLLDGHWVAHTNYCELIESISWKEASVKTMNLNSIAEITFHINYYLEGILNVFKGGNLEIKDKYSFDLAPINSDTDWKSLVDDFISNSLDFVRHVKGMSDERLDSTFVDEKYGSYQRNIEGVIEHCYYHLGQMVLIKKIIGN